MPRKLRQKTTETELEYLIAWVSQGLARRADINIYGNPAGLRRLAAMLLKVAEFDQSQGRYPDDDSLHCHLNTGLNTAARDDLPRLTLGRVEPKNGSLPIRYPFPELDFSEHNDALSDIPI